MAKGKEIFFLFYFTLVLSVALNSALPTLESMEELKKSGFGKSYSPHGIELLKWYVQKCTDNNMVALCDPVKEEYGFHLFKNIDNPLLLPTITDEQYSYYTLGNLKETNARNLPDKVKVNKEGNEKEVNVDRVVVKYNKNKRRIEEIYASAHYNLEKTYKIDPKLLDFLRQPRNV